MRAMWCWRGLCVCVCCEGPERIVYVINKSIDGNEARVFDFRRLHVFIEKPQP